MDIDVCYSIDQENFTFTDIHGALDALDNDGRLEVGALYFESDSEPVSAASYLKSDRILDLAQDAICDECGEWADDFFAVSREACAELDALLSAWADKHITSSGWKCVGKTRKRRVTAEELAEFHTPACRDLAN